MRNGKITTLQLGRGMGKNPLNAQYVELLPVNVLMIPRKLLTPPVSCGLSLARRILPMLTEYRGAHC